MVELAASAKALSNTISHILNNNYLRASGLLLLKGTGKNSNKKSAQGSNIMTHIDFFKREAKNFLKDWRTQKITQNTDGSYSYHYDWKFYDIDYIFSKLKLDNKDRQEITITRAQHWFAQTFDQKSWKVLISLTDTEQEKLEQKIRFVKDVTAYVKAPEKPQHNPCFRIRCQNEMTLKDKESFTKALSKIITKINKAPNEKRELWDDYFDYWTNIDFDDEYLYFAPRREYLKEKLKNNNSSFAKQIRKAYQKFTKIPYMGCNCPVVITELCGELRIKIFKANFGTDKISGFCTSLLKETFNTDITIPVIIINEVYCNTPEKYLKEIAKQFYYMIAKPDEFDYQEENGIRYEMKSTQKEAEDFAENIFIPTEYVNGWLNSFVEQEQKFSPQLTQKDKDLFLRNYEMEYIVNRLKRVFYVDYKTAIKKLLESDWQYKFMFDSYEEAETFYLECLKKHDEEYVDKIEWLNGEPEPLPWDYTDFSATRQYINIENE